MSDRTVRTKQGEFVIGKRCDVCGKEIPPMPESFPREAFPYFLITIGHHDWGNDSADSIEHLDACSPVCALQLAHEQLNEDFDHTRTIEIEQVSGWLKSPAEEETEDDGT